MLQAHIVNQNTNKKKSIIYFTVKITMKELLQSMIIKMLIILMASKGFFKGIFDIVTNLNVKKLL